MKPTTTLACLLMAAAAAAACHEQHQGGSSGSNWLRCDELAQCPDHAAACEGGYCVDDTGRRLTAEIPLDAAPRTPDDSGTPAEAATLAPDTGAPDGGPPDAGVEPTDADARVEPTDASCESKEQAYASFLADNRNCERDQDCTMIGDCGPNADFAAVAVSAMERARELQLARCSGTYDGPVHAAVCEQGRCMLSDQVVGCCGCAFEEEDGG